MAWKGKGDTEEVGASCSARCFQKFGFNSGSIPKVGIVSGHLIPVDRPSTLHELVDAEESVTIEDEH